MKPKWTYADEGVGAMQIGPGTFFSDSNQVIWDRVNALLSETTPCHKHGGLLGQEAALAFAPMFSQGSFLNLLILKLMLATHENK